ncbi:MAG: nucleotidyltransferase family protein [Microthrixaceae bacterium]|jgi:predicted nucleotidyltransferase|nr:nucleotidyltransferase family protein [Microthrixaceae bacterium]MCB0987061.1 nucleotidyltransferase family protein [Acidimicrobiales bacterium]MCB9405016.1 nucleotidyltransferase family protein [Microthrixaceae bacterium]
MGALRGRLDERRQEILDVVRRHRGRSVALFGSVARGDETASSDVDLLVDFEADSSLFDLLHLQDELSALLGCPVDVVSARALKPRDEHIRAEAVPL